MKCSDVEGISPCIHPSRSVTYIIDMAPLSRDIGQRLQSFTPSWSNSLKGTGLCKQCWVPRKVIIFIDKSFTNWGEKLIFNDNLFIAGQKSRLNRNRFLGGGNQAMERVKLKLIYKWAVLRCSKGLIAEFRYGKKICLLFLFFILSTVMQ